MRIVCGSRLRPGLAPIEIVERYKFRGKMVHKITILSDNNCPCSECSLFLYRSIIHELEGAYKGPS